MLLLGWDAQSLPKTQDFETVTVTAMDDPPPLLAYEYYRAEGHPVSPVLFMQPPNNYFELNRGATKQPTDDKRDKADACAGERSGNPVVLSTGNKVEQEMDFTTPGEMGLFLEKCQQQLQSDPA